MKGAIHSINLGSIFAAAGNIRCQTVLPGEIPGLATRAIAIPAGQNWATAPNSELGQAYLLVGGRGEIWCTGQPLPVHEISLFIPRQQDRSEFRSETGLKILEITIGLTDEDRAELASRADVYPWFMPYSRCKTYRERIKSPKTINRTLLPEDTFPRLCIGSVETTGPDQVAAHRHPMLEQLFLGLAENDCVVTADSLQAHFGAYDLLHIPPGSEHGVEVADGRKLHYVWIDFFRDRAGMEWIRREHVADK